METALRLAGGIAEIGIVVQADGSEELITFSEHLACTFDNLSFEEPEPRNFSFNSPYGACPACDGLGTRFEVDPELVVPNGSKSIAEGAIAPWAGGRSRWYRPDARVRGGVAGIRRSTRPGTACARRRRSSCSTGWARAPFTCVTATALDDNASFVTHYEGVVPWLQRRHREADSDPMREWIETFMREVPCPACGGARSKPESLAVTVGGRSIHELCTLSVAHAAREVQSVELTEREHLIADRVLREVQARLQFLLDVGLDYLSLARPTASLSGGEAQRIRLASQIGSGLVGVLYVLDEPSIGLHQRDNRRLLDTLVRLRDLGNTVIVVEHDEETIRSADHVVDIGPGAGEHGGGIVYSGPVPGLLSSKKSITGRYLDGRALDRGS